MEVLEKNRVSFEVDHIPCCHLGRFWKKNVDIEKMKKGLNGPHLSEKKKVMQCKSCELKSLCSRPRKDYIEVRIFKKGKILI